MLSSVKEIQAVFLFTHSKVQVELSPLKLKGILRLKVFAKRVELPNILQLNSRRCLVLKEFGSLWLERRVSFVFRRIKSIV